jgi:hypothetical protein
MARTSADTIEWGDLGPLRALLGDLKAWEEHDAERGRSEELDARTVTDIRGRLEKALADAHTPAPRPSISDLAEKEGVTPWALYKRAERARKSSGAAV